MKKELTLRTLRIILAMTFGVILFPALENYLTVYSSETSLFFLLSSLVVGALSILFHVLISIIRRGGAKDSLIEYIHYSLRLILMSIFTAYCLTLLDKQWVLILIIGIEIYGIFFNEEFVRVKKAQ